MKIESLNIDDETKENLEEEIKGKRPHRLLQDLGENSNLSPEEVYAKIEDLVNKGQLTINRDELRNAKGSVIASIERGRDEDIDDESGGSGGSGGSGIANTLLGYEFFSDNGIFVCVPTLKMNKGQGPSTQTSPYYAIIDKSLLLDSVVFLKKVHPRRLQQSTIAALIGDFKTNTGTKSSISKIQVKQNSPDPKYPPFSSSEVLIILFATLIKVVSGLPADLLTKNMYPADATPIRDGFKIEKEITHW